MENTQQASALRTTQLSAKMLQYSCVDKPPAWGKNEEHEKREALESYVRKGKRSTSYVRVLELHVRTRSHGAGDRARHTNQPEQDYTTYNCCVTVRSYFYIPVEESHTNKKSEYYYAYCIQHEQRNGRQTTGTHELHERLAPVVVMPTRTIFGCPAEKPTSCPRSAVRSSWPGPIKYEKGRAVIDQFFCCVWHTYIDSTQQCAPLHTYAYAYSRSFYK